MKFPGDFEKRDSIWIADNFSLDSKDEKLSDTLRFLLDISKLRIFSTFEFSTLLRFWCALGWIKDYCHTYSIKNCRLMDVGCSQSYLYHMWHRNCNYMIRPVLTYYGIDGNKSKLKKGRDIYPKAPRDKLIHILADVSKPIRFKKKFDIIVCMEIMEHIKRKKVGVLFKNLHKNLADDGMVILSSPNRDIKSGEKWIWGEGSKRQHEYEYSFRQACKIVRKYGFVINTFHGLIPRRDYVLSRHSNEHVKWIGTSFRNAGIENSISRSIMCFLDPSTPWKGSKVWMMKLYKDEQRN